MFYTFLSTPPLVCEKSKSQKLNPIMPARGAHTIEKSKNPTRTHARLHFEISHRVWECSVGFGISFSSYYFVFCPFFLVSLFHIPTQVPSPFLESPSQESQGTGNPNRACAHSIIMIRWLLITKFICAPAFSCSFSPRSQRPEIKGSGNWTLNTEN